MRLVWSTLWSTLRVQVLHQSESMRRTVNVVTATTLWLSRLSILNLVFMNILEFIYEFVIHS